MPYTPALRTGQRWPNDGSMTSRAASLNYQFGDGSAAVTVGAMALLAALPFPARVVASDLMADRTGSAVVDVQTSTDGATWATIAGSTPPALSSAQVAPTDTALAGWSVDLAPGVLLRAVVVSASVCRMLAGALHLERKG